MEKSFFVFNPRKIPSNDEMKDIAFSAATTAYWICVHAHGAQYCSTMQYQVPYRRGFVAVWKVEYEQAKVQLGLNISVLEF